MDDSFGFAVQPLLTKHKDQLTYLVQGQFQLPIYCGQCPDDIL